MKLLTILASICCSFLYGSVELSLENYSSLDGTAEVIYNSSVDIGGFQFDIEGATLTGASGGEAENNGFVQSSSPTTMVYFVVTWFKAWHILANQSEFGRYMYLT